MGVDLRGRRSLFYAGRSQRTSFLGLGLLAFLAYMILSQISTYYNNSSYGDRNAISRNNLQFVDPTLINAGNPVQPDCSPLHPKVIVYNRIPKAGSSTLIELLRTMSKANKFRVLLPSPKHDPVAARNAIVYALESNTTSVIVQHFHFPDIIDDRLAYINVMRNPVDRCVSAYYYLRYGPRGESAKATALRRYGNMTLEACLDRPYGELEQCFNCPSQGQARFFCGPENGICDRPQADEMLRRAWFTMQTQYFVGTTEDLEKTVYVMESLYPEFFRGMGVELSKQPPLRVNADSYEPPSKRTRKKIESWTAVDTELYRRVVKKLGVLYTACAARRRAEGMDMR